MLWRSMKAVMTSRTSVDRFVALQSAESVLVQTLVLYILGDQQTDGYHQNLNFGPTKTSNIAMIQSPKIQA